MNKERRCSVKKTWAVQVQSRRKGQLIQSDSQTTWKMLCIHTPQMSHCKKPVPFLKIKCSGSTKLLLIVMTRSLAPNSHMFLVKVSHCLKLKGCPKSFMFRSIVVMTMMANPIQNSTKKPLKSA